MTKETITLEDIQRGLDELKKYLKPISACEYAWGLIEYDKSGSPVKIKLKPKTVEDIKEHLGFNDLDEKKYGRYIIKEIFGLKVITLEGRK